MGHVTWTRPFQGRFVLCRLGLAVFNPHTKFEMSTMTCNEDVKGNAKCKNSRKKLQFSLALTAAALLSEICRNRRFRTGVGHFERKF